MICLMLILLTQGESTILFNGTTDNITDIWDNVINAEMLLVCNFEDDNVATVACKYCVAL